jgi:hypothetical protein
MCEVGFVCNVQGVGERLTIRLGDFFEEVITIVDYAEGLARELEKIFPDPFERGVALRRVVISINSLFKTIDCVSLARALADGLAATLLFIEGHALEVCVASDLPSPVCAAVAAGVLAWVSTHIPVLEKLIEKVCGSAVAKIAEMLPDPPITEGIESIGVVSPHSLGSPRPFAPGMTCGSCGGIGHGVHQRASSYEQGSRAGPLLQKRGPRVPTHRRHGRGD